MKRYLTLKYLPLGTLILSLVVYMLRTVLWISAIGAEDGRLLPAGTWPDTLSWIVVCGTMAFLIVATWTLCGATKYSYNFPTSIPAAIGMVLAGVGFCITSVADLSVGTDSIGTTSAVLGFLAAGALAYLAYARIKGIRLSVVFHGIVCLYLMLHLISHYRLWSSFPQLQTYAFELLAIVFVMLACYHRTAFDAGKGNRRAYTLFSLAALFFCVATLPGCDNAAFFIGCAIWMYTTPCRLTHAYRGDEQ